MNRTQQSLAAIVAAVIFAAAACAQETVPTSATLFTNVRIFDGKSDKLSAPSHVLVRGNKIEKISAQPIPTDRRGDTFIIDGAGKTLMPGLIDNHVHLFMAGSSEKEMMAPNATVEGLEATAAEQARLMLLRGFTSARDVGGPVFGVKRMIDSGKVPGPRLYPSGAMIS